MSNHYRILGNLLEAPDLFIDVSVTNVEINSTVHLEEAIDTEPRTWTCDLDDFDEWHERNDVVATNELNDPDHHIWNDLTNIYGARNDGPHETAASSIEGDVVSLTQVLLFAHQQ